MKAGKAAARAAKLQRAQDHMWDALQNSTGKLVSNKVFGIACAHRRGQSRTHDEAVLVDGDMIRMATQVHQSARSLKRRGVCSHVDSQCRGLKKMMTNARQVIAVQCVDDANMWVQRDDQKASTTRGKKQGFKEQARASPKHGLPRCVLAPGLR